ncbi:MAG: aspartate aminotransferase family protein, partial [Acetobacteraceae bacterium]|nr:aspartate aminotransferase family protein [Acetobacteraceae bacterium]
GRTGRWFALGRWDVEPDIVSFAKGVTSGYLPLGGIILSRKVHQALEDAPLAERYMHAATYSGHPACCAVGLANVALIEREGLVERAGVMGRRLLDGLETLRALPSVGDVRGLGMLAGVELVEDKASRKPAIGLGAKVVVEAMRRGLILRARGGTPGYNGGPPSGDSLCLAPPLMTPETTIDRIVEIVGESIAAVA